MIRVRSATITDLDSLTTIIAEAFSVKMHVLFGRDPEQIACMLRGMYSGPLSRHYDGLLIAELDDDPIGALAIEPMPWQIEDVERLDTLTHTLLSPWRQRWNRLGFSVFTHGPTVNDAYITDVGVLRRARGHGAGRALMQSAEQWAIAHDRRTLSLWVASNNQVARHLYEQVGLRVVRSEMNWLSGALYGIPRWTYMVKQLPNNSPNILPHALHVSHSAATTIVKESRP